MYEYPMEQLAKDIREVTAKALESKESALKFLKDAGILEIIENPEEDIPTETEIKNNPCPTTTLTK